MNQVFAAATALILAGFLWSFGKKPRGGIITNTDKNNFGDLDIQQLSLVETTKESIGPDKKGNSFIEKSWQPPKTIQERIKLEKQLHKWITGDPEERLKSVTVANIWGHKNVLPILRRALKDSDSRVVLASAVAIQKFRGVTIQEIETRRPPLNVSLMR